MVGLLQFICLLEVLAFFSTSFKLNVRDSITALAILRSDSLYVIVVRFVLA